MECQFMPLETRRLTVLDTFSGVGGFSLGLEATSVIRTGAFCEADPHARQVLRKHWSNVPIFEDIKELNYEAYFSLGLPAPQIVCGGFPCQDVSAANPKAVGINGKRSGLWSELHRVIGEFRPRFVILENSSMLLGRGLVQVLQDLDAIGYDAEWHCIPASAAGARHRRDRIWIVAYTHDDLRRRAAQAEGRKPASPEHAGRASRDVADADLPGDRALWSRAERAWAARFEGWQVGSFGGSGGCSPLVTAELLRTAGEWYGAGRWGLDPATAESGLGGVAHGISDWVDRPGASSRLIGLPEKAAERARKQRIRRLGNAVVPPIPFVIGMAIVDRMRRIGRLST